MVLYRGREVTLLLSRSSGAHAIHRSAATAGDLQGSGGNAAAPRSWVLYMGHTVALDQKEGDPDFLGGKKEGKKGDISLFHFVLKCVLDMHLDDRFLHHFHQSMPQKVYP